jgi:hypothetical protein
MRSFGHFNALSMSVESVTWGSHVGMMMASSKAHWWTVEAWAVEAWTMEAWAWVVVHSSIMIVAWTIETATHYSIFTLIVFIINSALISFI